jgi:hypothetical protein
MAAAQKVGSLPKEYRFCGCLLGKAAQDGVLGAARNQLGYLYFTLVSGGDAFHV